MYYKDSTEVLSKRTEEGYYLKFAYINPTNRPEAVIVRIPKNWVHPSLLCKYESHEAKFGNSVSLNSDVLEDYKSRLEELDKIKLHLESLEKRESWDILPVGEYLASHLLPTDGFRHRFLSENSETKIVAEWQEIVNTARMLLGKDAKQPILCDELFDGCALKPGV